MHKPISSFLFIFFLFTAPLHSETPDSYMVSPYLEEKGLPATKLRLPDLPKLVEFPLISEQTIGKQGGAIKILMPRQKDIRLMVVYGYARLVGYSRNYELEADILEKIDVKDNKVFTLYLRKGHKWSDGHFFTAEDFRYYWEDVANNSELSPVGPPKDMLVNEKPPKFEVIDEHTIRYSWDAPNHKFLTALAKPYPLFIYRPAHYMKQFHEKYTEMDSLKALIKQNGQKSWASLHNKLDNMHKFDNPDLPTLQPWMNTTRPPTTQFIFQRNPYYHKVDHNGVQLPYIDEVHITIVNNKLISAKSAAGEVDLQARSLKFSDFRFLKQGEKSSDYKTYLWKTGHGSEMAIFPNLNYKDTQWRNLLRDVRFRKALSLAMDRNEINQILFYGLALPGNNTVQQDSPLYKTNYRTKFADQNIHMANTLLDELGLKRDAINGYRRLPDGQLCEIVIETAGEDTQQVDMLELISHHWKQIGIKVFIKPTQRDVFRNRVYSGETMMSVWKGIDNGIPTAEMSPDEFSPTRQDHLQWPKWGQYYETKGQAGEPIDYAPAKEIMDLYEQWHQSVSKDDKLKIWHKILEIYTNEVFTIGTVSQVKQPVVVKNILKNVPQNGIYNWHPGAHFGIFNPDSFWLEK